MDSTAVRAILVVTHIHIRQNDLDTLFGQDHAAVVYLALVDRADRQALLKTGLTINELCRRVQLHSSRVNTALLYLQGEGLICINKEKKYIEVVEEDKRTRVPFTFTDTDERKLTLLEAEVTRLTNENKRAILNIESGIRQTTREQERELIVELESTFGHGLQPVDAYWIGRMVSAFGPERVKAEFRRMKLAKNPIKALVASLSNKSRGQAAKQRDVEEKKVYYREL